MKRIIQNKLSGDSILLLLILGVATILRFWKFPQMPFMHDELSALIRVQAPNFSDLIEKGKLLDTTPIGIHVFVHYWSALVGKSETMIKLPFIICGITGIYYSYKIAKRWFNATVALFTTAFIATLQFPVMCGQLEQPYATGFLFCTLMTWCWTKFFFDANDHKKNITGFVIAASLCCYNNYFSLFFAAIVCITGLFFLNKEKAKLYLAGCAGILILFIPHFSITLFHFSGNVGSPADSMGGLSLSVWFLSFLKYLFQFSVWIYLLVIAIILGSIYFLNKERPLLSRMRIVVFIWMILPFLTVYFYPLKNTQAVQFSSLIFSLPFLLMFLFSFYKDLSIPIKSGIVVVILILNTFTLFALRKHNVLFYKQPCEQMALMSIETINEHGENNVTIAHATTDGFMDYYFDKYNHKFQFLEIDKPDTRAFWMFVHQQQTNYFVIGNPPLQYIPIIKEKYPYEIYKTEGFTTSVYCFTKEKPANEIHETVVHAEKNSFDKPMDKWNDFMKQVKKDSTGNSFYSMDSTMEFGCEYSTNITDVISSKHNILNVSVSVLKADSLANPVIVFDLHDGEKQIKWVGMEYNDYRFRKTGNKIYLSVLLSDLELKKYRTPIFKIYLWNKSKSNIAIDDFNVEMIESNPYIYGLYEPVK